MRSRVSHNGSMKRETEHSPGASLTIAVRRAAMDQSALSTVAYSGDGDRRFRFIVTGLERGEVLEVNYNSVGHDVVGVGADFGCFDGST